MGRLIFLVLLGVIGCAESEPSATKPSTKGCEEGPACDGAADAAPRDAGAAHDAGAKTVAECEQLRGCCYEMDGTSRGSCLATLASIERGTRPAQDCSSTLDGLLETGSCPGPDAGARDAGEMPAPAECLAARAACTRNGDCCGFSSLSAFCVKTGSGQQCLKSCVNRGPCGQGEVCTLLGAGDNAVCVP